MLSSCCGCFLQLLLGTLLVFPMEQLEFITYILMGILFTQRSCLLYAISVLVPFHGINNASSKIALIYKKKRPLCFGFLIALMCGMWF